MPHIGFKTWISVSSYDLAATITLVVTLADSKEHMLLHWRPVEAKILHHNGRYLTLDIAPSLHAMTMNTTLQG